MMITLPSYVDDLFIYRNDDGDWEWIPSDFKVLYGGRSGAKSETLGTLLLLRCLNAKTHNIIARRTEVEILDTVLPMMKYLIERTKLSNFFTIKQFDIKGHNGSTISFVGMLDKWEKVKGMNHIDVFWYEEANTLPEQAYDLLLPSIRKKNSEIWFSFNPYSRDDVVYKKFILQDPPPNTIIKRVSYLDNDFHDEKMERLRLQSLQEDPLKYTHVWEGELMQGSESSYWKADLLERMTLDEYKYGYVRVVIAVDPATTHAEASNEYGIIVVAEGFDGKFYILEDASSVMTPQFFIDTIDVLHLKYQAECVVVETNQGGDFIKHAILVHNPHIVVREVKASKSKHLRALPVAQISEQGRLFFIGHTYGALKTQMMLMTSQGYQGKKGESPDRLDALVWGVYYLGNLAESDTINTIFKPEYFEVKKDGNSIGRATYAFIGSKQFCMIGIEGLSINGKRAIRVTSFDIGTRETFAEFALLQKKKITLVNTKNARAFVNVFEGNGIAVRLTDRDFLGEQLTEIKVAATLPYFEQSLVQVESEALKTRLLQYISRYTYGTKIENVAVDCITAIVANVWEIEDEEE